MMHEVEVLA